MTKFTIRYPRIAELEPGTFFTVAGDATIFMTVGKAEDGRRSVVNMKTYEVQQTAAQAIVEGTYVGDLTLHVLPATLKKEST